MCQNDIFYRTADENALIRSLGLDLESPHYIYIMVKVGKILMRIGLLFRVIRNVSPLEE